MDANKKEFIKMLKVLIKNGELKAIWEGQVIVVSEVFIDEVGAFVLNADIDCVGEVKGWLKVL